MPPAKVKSKDCEEGRDVEISEIMKSVLNSDFFKNIIGDIVKSEIKVLNETITELRNEVDALKESNKDLVRLFANSEDFDKRLVSNDKNYPTVKDTRSSAKEIYHNKKNIDKKNVSTKTTQVKTTNTEQMSTISSADNNKLNKEITSRKIIKNKTKVVFGSGSQKSTKSGFTAVTRRIWLYVGRATPGTTVDNMKALLEEKFPENDFIVEKLPKWKNGTTESFKIGADFELYDTLFEGDTWPQGTLVKRYRFFRDEQ